MRGPRGRATFRTAARRDAPDAPTSPALPARSPLRRRACLGLPRRGAGRARGGAASSTTPASARGATSCSRPCAEPCTRCGRSAARSRRHPELPSPLVIAHPCSGNRASTPRRPAVRHPFAPAPGLPPQPDLEVIVRGPLTAADPRPESAGPSTPGPGTEHRTIYPLTTHTKGNRQPMQTEQGGRKTIKIEN
jgi:hypothetical protein